MRRELVELTLAKEHEEIFPMFLDSVSTTRVYAKNSPNFHCCSNC